MEIAWEDKEKTIKAGGCIGRGKKAWRGPAFIAGNELYGFFNEHKAY